MITEDYLANVSEKQMFQFLETRFGSCLESVSKYYDDTYQGYLFKVKLNGGIDYLPKERNNTLRAGVFGLVKDDESSAFPRIINNFDIAKTAPKFFKSYIEFINENNGDRRIRNKTYLESFKETYSLYILMDKLSQTRKLEEEEKKQKMFLKEIIQGINERNEIGND